MCRKGFALLATLWVTVSLAAMALTGLLVARGVVNGTRNRIMIARGQWQAEDCLQRSRMVIDDALNQRIPGRWESLDNVVSSAPAISEAACDVTLVPTGMSVDINTADHDQLLLVLRAIGIDESRADSMVDALLDWRDTDDVPRPMGAEADWYRANGRFPPRNGPFADVMELRRVRGFGVETVSDSMLRTVFAVEPGRITWSRAPLAVLASVPGVGDEALAYVVDLRSRGIAVTGVGSFERLLTLAARERMDADLTEIGTLTTNTPDGWILTARSSGVTVELRLVLVGRRAAIVRRRSTP